MLYLGNMGRPRKYPDPVVGETKGFYSVVELGWEDHVKQGRNYPDRAVCVKDNRCGHTHWIPLYSWVNRTGNRRCGPNNCNCPLRVKYRQSKSRKEYWIWCWTGPSGKYVEVFEHVIIMSRMLGRELAKHETVHHKDNDGLNNEPSNLQLRSGNHGRGTVAICNACGSKDIGFPDLD
jgi:hypothetical protein